MPELKILRCSAHVILTSFLIILTNFFVPSFFAQQNNPPRKKKSKNRPRSTKIPQLGQRRISFEYRIDDIRQDKNKLGRLTKADDTFKPYLVNFSRANLSPKSNLFSLTG